MCAFDFDLTYIDGSISDVEKTTPLTITDLCLYPYISNNLETCISSFFKKTV